ncbi:MAG: hypothetical protein HAW60_04625, partial [Bdellovibrionales bacterium]|nr:hypothetical protein [Bdellovibrionales bacterium]
MKVTESKQKVFFLILGLFGIILTGNLLFGIKSVSYTQASLSDYSYYNKYSTLDSLKYLPTTFSNVYNPKDKVSLSFTIKKLESHQKFFKKPVSVSLDTKAFYAKTKHKKLLTILCKKEYNSEHKIMTQKEREKKFISTVLPYIVYFNTQVLKQRSNLLNILKNNLSDIKLSAYKNYMISRFSKKETPYVKDRYIQKSKFQRSKIKSLSSLNKSSLIDNSYS